MPRNLKRYQQNGDFHFITFSCYGRQALPASSAARCFFEQTLERVRRWYGLRVCGYVVMPEDVRLLVSEPEGSTLAIAIQMLKQITAKKLQAAVASPFWQVRYYDFNICTDRKRIDNLRYIYRNPVKRGLAASPQDWLWSGFLHYATGIEGTVEIASEWTAQRRERMRVVPPTQSPNGGDKDGAPDSC